VVLYRKQKEENRQNISHFKAENWPYYLDKNLTSRPLEITQLLKFHLELAILTNYFSIIKPQVGICFNSSLEEQSARAENFRMGYP
jgi:hypothetical protein